MLSMAVIFVTAINMILIIIVVRPATNSAAIVAHTAEVHASLPRCVADCTAGQVKDSSKTSASVFTGCVLLTL